jgi:hypothetical protein
VAGAAGGVARLPRRGDTRGAAGGARGRRWVIRPLSRLLLFVYFLEAGLLLLVAPWTTFWDRNYFVALVPALRPVVLSPFLRGAVSGIGLVCLAAAVAELAGLWGHRTLPLPGGGDGGVPADVEVRQ